MTSPLQTTQLFSGESSFYNGVISTSFKLDDGSSAHLHRTPAADSSDAARKKYTFSTWVKRSSLASTQQILAIGSGAGGAPWFFLYFTDADKIQAYWYSTTSGNATNSSPLFAPQFRDTSAWYNIVLVVDTTDGTATDRFKLYVNGVRAAVETAGNALLQNFIGVLNSNIKHYIGSNANTEQYLDAYLAETIMVDGTAIGETSGYLDEFGELKNGVWIPKSTDDLTYGANGFRLQYTSKAHDAPASEGSADIDNIGADSSGENNHWTALDAIVASDCALPDCPENNFCTMNVLKVPTSRPVVVSEGNLKCVGPAPGTPTILSTMAIPTTGKWYAEFERTVQYNGVGIVKDSIANLAVHAGVDANGYVYYDSGGLKYNNNSNASYGSSWSNGDIIGVAYNADDGELTFYKNNSSDGVAYSSLSGEFHFCWSDMGNNSNPAGVWNFGQDSSFAGNSTAQGNKDGNGQGDFFYTPPSGHLALCSANLPEPTIGPNSATKTTNHFNTVLWAGNGGNNAITGVGFQPDWLWSKDRNGTENHVFLDSSRGFTHRLSSNANDDETTDSNATITSFDADGFTLTQYHDSNQGSSTNVGWCWKANGGVATASGSESGNNPAHSVQANPTAGFSIVTYTGTGAAGTMPHGLGVVPNWILVKNRDSAGNWAMYHSGLASDAETDVIYLNLTNAVADSGGSGDTFWNDTAPTSSVFTVNSNGNVNEDGAKHIAYCFAEVEGYSKFGSYTGNANADGTFVFTGFRPAFVMCRMTASAGWHIFDNKRAAAFNQIAVRIEADNSDAENATSGCIIDFLSNGFKFRGNFDNINAASLGIYMAFAEAPFKYANAR